MADNVTLLGPNRLTSDQILDASVPRVLEARKGMAFRVRTIAPPIVTPTSDALYSFASQTFTPAGATGRFGPTLTQCRSAYSTATWTQNPLYFDMTTQGYQVWTVPQTALYRIDTRGAIGGSGSSGAGGNGAQMIGSFPLTKGQKLRIVVGQSGTNNTTYNGGGGGASFVMKESGSTTADILVIAGGGGGGANSNNGPNRGATIADPSQPGWDGNTNVSLNNGQSGGSGGLMFDRSGSGAGGGGLVGNGQTAAGKGGQSFVNGAIGGYAFQSVSMEGGFGGGGSGDWYQYTGAGGAGGYSGGSGGYFFGSGGGGSSYNNGTSQSNTANQNASTGQVLIQLEDPPVLSTSGMSSITGTGATGGGTITNTKGITIASRGICWDTNTDPTIALVTKTVESGLFGLGVFTANITGLYGGTLYYVRAYATNIGGITGYGDSVTFTTSQTAPIVSTISGTSISGGSSVISASILSTGGSIVTTRGVCWDASTTPTTSSSKTTESGPFGTGPFTATATGMSGSSYYVRAYATNTLGTSYGNQITVTAGYRYYRWRITNVRSFSSANSVQVAEFKFQINGVDQSMSGVSASNPQGNNPGGEAPSNLIDNNISTKWLDFNIKTNTYSNFIFDFGIGQTRAFNGYRWATANDATERDPITWTIDVSNDNSNWTTLHTVTNFSPTSARTVWLDPWTY